MLLFEIFKTKFFGGDCRECIEMTTDDRTRKFHVQYKQNKLLSNNLNGWCNDEGGAALREFERLPSFSVSHIGVLAPGFEMDSRFLPIIRFVNCIVRIMYKLYSIIETIRSDFWICIFGGFYDIFSLIVIFH